MKIVENKIFENIGKQVGVVYSKSLAESHVEAHHQNEAENRSPRSLSSVSAAKCQRGLLGRNHLALWRALLHELDIDIISSSLVSALLRVALSTSPPPSLPPLKSRALMFASF